MTLPRRRAPCQATLRRFSGDAEQPGDRRGVVLGLEAQRTPEHFAKDRHALGGPERFRAGEPQRALVKRPRAKRDRGDVGGIDGGDRHRGSRSGHDVALLELGGPAQRVGVEADRPQHAEDEVRTRSWSLLGSWVDVRGGSSGRPSVQDARR